MQVFVATGDDEYQIEEFVKLKKKELDSAWLDLNYHEFLSENLKEAIGCIRSIPFSNSRKLVVIRGEIEKEQVDIIEELLENRQESTIVIFLTHLDGRTQVGKLLTSKTQVKQFKALPGWRIKELTQACTEEGAAQGIQLPLQVAQYIAEAVGNDRRKLSKEIEKLILCRGKQTIKISEVKKLIPSITHSSLELASAIKNKDAISVSKITEVLLCSGEHPLLIVAAVLSLVRTWLKLKAALEAGIRDDKKLVEACEIGNPSRLYYLKQEVKNISLTGLMEIAIAIFETECEIKQGLEPSKLKERFLILIKLD